MNDKPVIHLRDGRARFKRNVSTTMLPTIYLDPNDHTFGPPMVDGEIAYNLLYFGLVGLYEWEDADREKRPRIALKVLHGR